MMVSLSESSSVTSDFSASSSSATASSLPLSSSSSSARAAAKADVRGGFSGCLSSETAAADPLGFLGFLVVDAAAAAVAAVVAVASSESTTLRFRPRPLPTLTSLGSSGDEEDEVSWACSAPLLGPLFDGIEGVPSSFVVTFGFRPFLAGVG